MHGKALLAIPTSFENTKFPSVVERIKNLVTSCEEALAAHELARSRMAEQIKLNFTPFKKGQMLKLPESWKIHKVFHATLLCPYKENEVYGENYPQPLPDVEDGEEVYEAEQVLKHRRRGQGYEYLVKWAGYPITEALWEPKSSFTGAAEISKEYQEHHQL